MKITTKKPRRAGHTCGASMSAFAGSGMRSNSTTTRTPRLPKDWRSKLPDTLRYYAQHVAGLGRPNTEGWAQGRCPLHEDRHESLSVNVAGGRGGWRCFAGCGAGDLVSFHQRLRGLDFAAAVRDLIGWRP